MAKSSKSLSIAAHPSVSQIIRTACVGLALAATAPFSNAVTWTGSVPIATWETPGYWNPGVPTGLDEATLGSTLTSSTITLAGTALNPTQVGGLTFASGTGVELGGGAGYLQINTGKITTGVNGKSVKITANTLYIPASNAGGNNVWALTNSSMTVSSQIAVIGGVGTPTITKTGNNLLLTNTNQSYTGNWDISGSVYTNFSGGLGSGAVNLQHNAGWISGMTGSPASLTYANNFTCNGVTFIANQASGTTTLTGNLGGIAGSDIYFNRSGSSFYAGSKYILAGTTSFTSGAFNVIGGLQMDTTGNLAGVNTVYINRNTGAGYKGYVHWNVEDNVGEGTTFSARTSPDGVAEMGMITSGTTTVSGTVKLNSSTTLTDGANLQLNTVSGGALMLAGSVTDGANATVRSVNKVGAGTAVLSGSNDYRGGTNVTEGTLLVNNASGSGVGSGSVTIAAGATFGGSGFIQLGAGNTISTASGSIIAPGSDTGLIGTLTLDGVNSNAGALATFVAGATFDFDLNAATETSDLIALINGKTGALAFNNNVINFTLVGTLAAGQSYILFSGLGTDNYSGLSVDADNVIISGLSFTGLPAEYSSGDARLSLVDGNIMLDVVPEPATWSMLLGGLGMMGFVQRIRRRMSL